MEFEGKVAIVTGATSGIGMATAFRFANEGARVAAVGRRKDALAKLDRPNIRTYPVDLTSEKETETLIQSVLRDLGGIDILVLRHRADEEEELMGRKMQLVDDREIGRDGREMFCAVRQIVRRAGQVCAAP